MEDDVAEFDFRWDPGVRPLLALAGVRPETAVVSVTPERLIVAFGPWRLTTPLFNVVDATVGGPYAWYRAIGARLSLADLGVTFGTGVERGVCIRFRRPVAALEPLGLLRHPGATVTVADPDGLVAALTEHGAGLGRRGR